jgi:membrane-associated protein
VLDFILHSDRHLLEFVGAYGTWVYGLLFAIVFAETGLVVAPFLPGDSLLFATGALCSTGVMDTPAAFGLLALAAFTGNTVNYAVGRIVGPRVFSASDHTGISHRLLNREHLARAHGFFEQYGGKAVILSRFMPIIRTFVPFVAGAAAMRSHAFVLYNLVGAVSWVGLCLGAGVLFGNVPIVKEHFSLVTIGIVLVSLLPLLVGYLREHGRSTGGQAQSPGDRRPSVVGATERPAVSREQAASKR